MGRRALSSSSMDTWAGHGLMVARDSAVKLLAVIYDVYSVSSPSGVASSLHGKLPWGTGTRALPHNGVGTRPWDNVFLVSCGMAQTTSYNRPQQAPSVV